MKHVSIVVPNGQRSLSTVACIVGTCEILSIANEYWVLSGNKTLLQIELVGESENTTCHQDILTLHAHKKPSDLERTDLIIIPSLSRNFQDVVKDNKGLIEWIEKQYKEGAEVACMCTGSFMLAATGLLNGRRCATHWSANDVFRTLFPQVKMQTDQLITDEKGIYTNGGAYSFLNLVIYLVEKYFNREIAICCSKIFQIEYDRNTQSPYTIFTGQKSHNDKVIATAQKFIENNLDEKLSVEQLAAMCSISRRNFDRRFIKATGNTPLEYSQRVKIESAKRAFETSRKTVNEVMYEVGYSDLKAFREVFRKITGLSPLEYRSKYHNKRVYSTTSGE
jgi:transcriptional regulator GlxA family with amidase domain